MGLKLKKKSRQSRRVSPFSKRDLILTAGIMVVAVVVIILTLQFRQGVDTVVMENGAYQFFGEQKLSYTGKTKLRYENGTAVLTDSTGEHTIDSKPLYASDQELVLPVTYAWYELDSGSICRLEHFSKVDVEGNQIVLKDGNRKKTGARGFIYDGQNTYLFLEQVEITVGDHKVTLAPLSYVVSQYGSSLQYYAMGTGKSVVIQADGADQLAKFTNGDTLNLGTDTLNKANGSWQLLVADPGIMDRMD